MSKARRTLIAFVLDETGSMQAVKDTAISGFNEYLETLAASEESGRPIFFRLTRFNSERLVHSDDASRIGTVPHLTNSTYRPAHLTPLYDAIGQTISRTQDSLKRWKTETAVTFVILTDGLENASKEYDRYTIFDLIDQKQEEAGWTFVFLGANQDAYASGRAIGVPAGNISGYDALKTKMAMIRAAKMTSSHYRRGSAFTKEIWKESRVKKPEESGDDDQE